VTPAGAEAQGFNSAICRGIHAGVRFDSAAAGWELPTPARGCVPSVMQRIAGRTSSSGMDLPYPLGALGVQRATGKDPTNTPEARAKRRESLIAERAARDSWERENPGVVSDTEDYVQRVAPPLRAVPLGRIAQATGLSISAVSRIRGGTLTPHPRHWDARQKLAEPWSGDDTS